MISPSGLRPGGECLEALANLYCSRRIQLAYVHVLELQHKPQPVVRVPAERESGDLLLAAIDTAGDALRHARNDVAVEADGAVASSKLPSADAAILEAERVIDLGPGPGSPRNIIGDGLSGDDPAGIDITAVEAKPGRGHAQQFRLVYADLVELAGQQEVAPAGAERAAVSIRTLRGQGAGADERVEIDFQLGLVRERQSGSAYPGRSVCVYVRVERHLTRELCMEVPILVVIGPSREPSNRPDLLTVEESWPLGAEKRAGQIG